MQIQENTTALDELISAREVRQLLGISRQRVNQLRNEGKLSAVKHSIWLYNREEVLALRPSLRSYSKGQQDGTNGD